MARARFVRPRGCRPSLHGCVRTAIGGVVSLLPLYACQPGSRSELCPVRGPSNAVAGISVSKCLSVCEGSRGRACEKRARASVRGVGGRVLIARVRVSLPLPAILPERLAADTGSYELKLTIVTGDRRRTVAVARRA